MIGNRTDMILCGKFNTTIVSLIVNHISIWAPIGAGAPAQLYAGHTAAIRYKRMRPSDQAECSSFLPENKSGERSGKKKKSSRRRCHGRASATSTAGCHPRRWVAAAVAASLPVASSTHVTSALVAVTPMATTAAPMGRPHVAGLLVAAHA